MKLIHPNSLFPIEFNENKITNVIIESPQIFSDYLGELYHQVMGLDGRWILYEKGDVLNIEKVCEVIINPYSLDVNNRKIISKLYENIKRETISSELLLKWNQLYPYLAKLINELIDDLNYHLKFIEEIDVKDFLKFMDLRFETDNVGIIEKIVDYVSLYHEIIGTKLFVFVNIKSFLTEEHLKFIYEQAFYKKFYILLLENHDLNTENILEKRYIIDKDSCAICL